MRPRDFDRLYAENAGPLLAFLTFRTGDPDLADDLTADTFERALRSGKRFDPRRSSARTWLFSIALNLLRDHGRRAEAGRRASARSEADRLSSDDGGLGQVEQRDRVARAMGSLSPKDRELVALRYGADLPLKEIAKLTDQSTGTAAARLYRALEKMANALAE